jgi:hypothetical protein
MFDNQLVVVFIGVYTRYSVNPIQFGFDSPIEA